MTLFHFCKVLQSSRKDGIGMLVHKPTYVRFADSRKLKWFYHLGWLGKT